nr:ABC transporter substrate-binding protein [Cohnella algarum]
MTTERNLQSNSPAQAEQSNYTFTDTSGKQITLNIPIQTAIIINRNTAEAIKLLGADDRVAATGDATIKNNPYLGFQSLPDVGETGQLNLETILSLKPQAVFTYTNRPDRKLEEKLEPAGIKVVRMNNYLPDQTDSEWELLGKLFGKEERAAQFLEWKHGIERISAERIQSIGENDKKSVMALSAGFLNSDGAIVFFRVSRWAENPGWARALPRFWLAAKMRRIYSGIRPKPPRRSWSMRSMSLREIRTLLRCTAHGLGDTKLRTFSRSRTRSPICCPSLP